MSGEGEEGGGTKVEEVKISAPDESVAGLQTCVLSVDNTVVMDP